MKTHNLLLVTLICTSLILSSCSKNDDLVPQSSSQTTEMESSLKADSRDRHLDDFMADPISHSPSPFSTVTTITYRVTVEGKVRLYIFDEKHNIVADIGALSQKPGVYTFDFDATGMPAGEYTAFLEVGDATIIKEDMVKLAETSKPTPGLE